MLTAHHIDQSYNLNIVLKDVSFSLNPSDRVGLIGPNGCGKTTLLRILAGQEQPASGTVTRTPSTLRLAYLAQGFEIDPRKTIAEVTADTLGNPDELESKLTQIAAQLARSPSNLELQEAYDEVLGQLERFDPAVFSRFNAILAELGLGDIPTNQPVGHLSGGQKTRLNLALALVGNPQLLLLDEPTNHLDIGMLEWLEGWLAVYPGAALIVSHDRTFLDHTVTRILDLDPHTHSIREYAGNYSAYLDAYLAEQERNLAAYRDQVAEIRRMRVDIQRTKQQAAWVEQTTTSRQPVVRRYAKKVARKAKSREKKLDRYLDSEERLEKPKLGWQLKLDFSDQPDKEAESYRLGRDVLSLEKVTIGYPNHPPLLSNIELRVQAGRRIALTGPNGAGKTTLLRTIAGLLPALDGQVHLGSSVRLGYMSQEQELLDHSLNAVQTIQRVAPLKETEIRSFLHFFLFSDDDPIRPISQLSYGERSRLSLAYLVAQGCNFLLLDEPINHLDIPSRTRFEQALSGFEGTILAVVHDRYFINHFATDVWEVIDGKLEQKVL